MNFVDTIVKNSEPASVVIDDWSGEYAFLRNDYKLSHYIELFGYYFPTAEHAYQAAKTTDEDVRAEIENTRSVSRVRRLGRSLSLRKNWDTVKLQAMEMILRSKFSDDNFDLAQKLVDTDNAELIMKNDRDLFWGQDHNGAGENHLGKLLMKIRSELVLSGMEVKNQEEDEQIDSSDFDDNPGQKIVDMLESSGRSMMTPEEYNEFSNDVAIFLNKCYNDDLDIDLLQKIYDICNYFNND